MDWQKFVETTDSIFTKGSIFRCKGIWPHEELVDLMLVMDHDSDSKMTFYVISGHKAGWPLIKLPLEANPGLKPGCIDGDWLRKNWTKWVYQTPIEEVLYCPKRIIGQNA